MTLIVILLLCLSVAAQDDAVATDSDTDGVEEHRSKCSQELAYILAKFQRNLLPFIKNNVQIVSGSNSFSDALSKTFNSDNAAEVQILTTPEENPIYISESDSATDAPLSDFKSSSLFFKDRPTLSVSDDDLTTATNSPLLVPELNIFRVPKNSTMSLPEPNTPKNNSVFIAGDNFALNSQSNIPSEPESNVLEFLKKSSVSQSTNNQLSGLEINPASLTFIDNVHYAKNNDSTLSLNAPPPLSENEFAILILNLRNSNNRYGGLNNLPLSEINVGTFLRHHFPSAPLNSILRFSKMFASRFPRYNALSSSNVVHFPPFESSESHHLSPSQSRALLGLFSIYLNSDQEFPQNNPFSFTKYNTPISQNGYVSPSMYYSKRQGQNSRLNFLIDLFRNEYHLPESSSSSLLVNPIPVSVQNLNDFIFSQHNRNNPLLSNPNDLNNPSTISLNKRFPFLLNNPLSTTSDDSPRLPLGMPFLLPSNDPLAPEKVSVQNLNHFLFSEHNRNNPLLSNPSDLNNPSTISLNKRFPFLLHNPLSVTSDDSPPLPLGMPFLPPSNYPFPPEEVSLLSLNSKPYPLNLSSSYRLNRTLFLLSQADSRRRLSLNKPSDDLRLTSDNALQIPLDQLLVPQSDDRHDAPISTQGSLPPENPVYPSSSKPHSLLLNYYLSPQSDNQFALQSNNAQSLPSDNQFLLIADNLHSLLSNIPRDFPSDESPAFPLDNPLSLQSGNPDSHESDNQLSLLLDNFLSSNSDSLSSDNQFLFQAHNNSSPAPGNSRPISINTVNAPSNLLIKFLFNLSRKVRVLQRLYNNCKSLKPVPTAATTFEARYSPCIKDMNSNKYNAKSADEKLEYSQNLRVGAVYGRDRGGFEDMEMAIQDRIIGGRLVSPGEVPYQVALYKLDVFLCGSSLISQRYILTAGHCLQGIRPEELWFRVGSDSLTEGGDTYSVYGFVIHEEYANADNDIALIKSTTPVKFGPNVKAIALPSRMDPHLLPYTSVQASGWGATELDNGAQPAYKLRKIELKIASRKRCRNRIMSSSKIITERQICSSAPVNAGTCFGDSGGPLVGNGKLVGIISWGSPCAIGDPDVYTNVQEFLPWIFRKIRMLDNNIKASQSPNYLPLFAAFSNEMYEPIFYK